MLSAAASSAIDGKTSGKPGLVPDNFTKKFVVHSCKWQVTNASNGINITSVSSGDGNGAVTYVISDYNGTNPQAGTISIAGQTVSVAQSSASAGTVTVPTITEWGMILFMIGAGLVSLYYLKGQRRA